MTAYDIHTDEAYRVLQNAGASAEDYHRDQVRVDQGFAELHGALPHSPHVAMRLGEFAENVVYPHLTTIFADTTEALQATTDALIAYQDSDEEMRRRGQAVAAGVTAPDVMRGSHRLRDVR